MAQAARYAHMRDEARDIRAGGVARGALSASHLKDVASYMLLRYDKSATPRYCRRFFAAT